MIWIAIAEFCFAMIWSTMRTKEMQEIGDEQDARFFRFCSIVFMFIVLILIFIIFGLKEG